MKIKGVIFDIGGVLYQGSGAIDGAVEALEKIKSNYKVAFATNTTRRAPCTIVSRLTKFGFDIKESEIFSALAVAKKLIEKENKSVYALLTQDALDYFGSLNSSADSVDYVLVGDAAENFNYAKLNRAFRYLVNGANLIAAAKNRYFKDSDGKLSMDAGGFVAALEYASLKEAKIIGKPQKEFFLSIVESLGLEPSEVVMVGDDIESDIKGALDAGLKAILVKTGKFKPSDLNKGINPSYIVDSIADIPTILEEL